MADGVAMTTPCRPVVRDVRCTMVSDYYLVRYEPPHSEVRMVSSPSSLHPSISGQKVEV